MIAGEFFSAFSSLKHRIIFIADKSEFKHSTLSLELEDDLFTPVTNRNDADSITDIIYLSDLTAPSHGCFCFKFHRLHCPRRHRRTFPDSPTDCCSNHLNDGIKITQLRDYSYNSTSEIPDGEVIRTVGESVNKPMANGQTADDQSISTTLKITIPNPEKSVELTTGATTKLRRQLQQIGAFVCKANQPTRLRQLRDWGFMVLISLVTTLLVSVSLSALIQCGARIYVLQMTSNSTTTEIVYTVRPPSFVTQFATAWTILIYPTYLLLNIPLRFEAISSKEMYINHMLILASDQPMVVKVVSRCILLSVLWQLFLNCFLRSLQAVSPIDCASILTVLPCFHYLLCWIIVHRRFCALRVIAFILASSGVILNIYSDHQVMWYKCLISMSVVAFALFNVVLKRITSRPTFGQFAAFYCGFGLFNIFVFWPIFVINSILTESEPIDWTLMPWQYCAGVGIALLGK
ncbi:Solute carrier family 35 member F4 [Paragonimus heterotremus]|uniref:Solute carrier family 35 member F4 n=1 Tax=Paragonimus heterotremus TaxID=100268 RepID=A0A8J4SVL9_9TREM|nr:Solute carrier family 35 member F4 [Paragonimus heterotremus]